MERTKRALRIELEDEDWGLLSDIVALERSNKAEVIRRALRLYGEQAFRRARELAALRSGAPRTESEEETPTNVQ